MVAAVAAMAAVQTGAAAAVAAAAAVMAAAAAATAAAVTAVPEIVAVAPATHTPFHTPTLPEKQKQPNNQAFQVVHISRTSTSGHKNIPGRENNFQSPRLKFSCFFALEV